MVQLSAHDTLVTEINAIILSNPSLKKENPLSEWMEEVHAFDVAIRVRRQLDKGKKAVSFRRLLQKIAPFADGLVAHRLKNKHEGVSEGHLRKALYGKDRTTLNVRADETELMERGERLLGYADRVVAHVDKRGIPQHLTWQEVHEYVDYLIDMVERYHLLVTGDGYKIRSPFPLAIKRYFQEPWVRQ